MPLDTRPSLSHPRIKAQVEAQAKSLRMLLLFNKRFFNSIVIYKNKETLMIVKAHGYAAGISGTR